MSISAAAYAALSLLLLSSTPSRGGHIADFPDAPPIDAADNNFEALFQKLERYYGTLYDAATTTWKTFDGDKEEEWGVNFTTANDPESGCPWLYAVADLPNCSLVNSAKFIVTELDKYQNQWDKKLLGREQVRVMNLSNGSMEIDWFLYDTGAFLSHRGYYNFGGWRWTAPGVLESPSASVYSREPPPPNGTASVVVRMAGRQWKRLTAASATSTRYEVLQSSDIFGVVPCEVTRQGQASVLHDEIAAYRAKVPRVMTNHHSHQPVNVTVDWEGESRTTNTAATVEVDYPSCAIVPLLDHVIAEKP